MTMTWDSGRHQAVMLYAVQASDIGGSIMTVLRALKKHDTLFDSRVLGRCRQRSDHVSLPNLHAIGHNGSQHLL